MKKIILCLLIPVMVFQACKKDETVRASDADVNWFQIPAGLPGELGKLRYDVYAGSGVCIFCSDTIGSEVRYNRAGEEYTYYEVLKPGYRIGGAPVKDVIEFECVEDEADLIEGVKLLRDNVIARVKPEYLPVCFVLTDDLWSGNFEKAGYRDFVATFIGKTSSIAGMTPQAKEALAWDIVGVVLAPHVMERFPESLELFYRKTNESVAQSKYQSFYSQNSLSSMFDPWLPSTPYGLGFLTWSGGFYIATVSQTMDVELFIGLVFSHTEAEVLARFAGYPVVVDKYYIMKEMLDWL